MIGRLADRAARPVLFIGGSGARIIMGQDEDALVRPGDSRKSSEQRRRLRSQINVGVRVSEEGPVEKYSP